MVLRYVPRNRTLFEIDPQIGNSISFSPPKVASVLRTCEIH